ncbi:MAG: molybdopterin-dependent oxidoreductase, partial [Rhodobacteraceae bacterium]|nr:molybdopterin-dependent oxidoreductase [Paracoccaceae bacterium]
MSAPTIHGAIAHDAARLHVCGQAAYVDDMEAPGRCFHLAFGLSTVASGVIESMDLSEVADHAGVRAVVTAADLPAANDVSPSPYPEPLLSEGEVNHVGQPIFLVVADSHRQARQAARLARISYLEREPILDIDSALAADSMFGPPLTYRCGDVDAALASARHRVSGQFTIGGQEHFYLEGQVAMATPTEHGGVLVHSSTQHPTEIQHKVADALGVSMSSVRVEVRRMGGAFGGKESQGNSPACACAVAARLTGRPCRIRYDRDDDMEITGKRHDFRIAYEAGFDDEGRIDAVDFVQHVRCGWSLDLSMPVADRAMLHADNAYHIPNLRITSCRLRTNTQSATAFRGFGGPQGMLGIERVVDHVAHALGADPLRIRRRNFYPPMNS